MQKNFQKKFLVFPIIASDLAALNCLCYEKGILVMGSQSVNKQC